MTSEETSAIIMECNESQNPQDAVLSKVKIGDDGTNLPKLILNYFEPSGSHPDPAKGTSSTYSPQLNKLFANIHKDVKIGFETDFAPAQKSYIRCTQRFELEEYQNEVVKRCPNHSEPNLFNGNHILTVDSTRSPRNVIYTNDSDGRPVVCIQYLDQAEHCRGEEFIIRFKFHCLSSCSSRRKMYLLFEVVHDNGDVMCSHTMPVLISTCPGRDRLRHEEKAMMEVIDADVEEDGDDDDDPRGDDDGVFLVEIDDPRARELLQLFMAGLEMKD